MRGHLELAVVTGKDWKRRRDTGTSLTHSNVLQVIGDVFRGIDTVTSTSPNLGQARSLLHLYEE